MRIYLKSYVMNLTKNYPDIAKSTFIPGRLSKLEKEMKSGKITADDVMERLHKEEKLKDNLSAGEWKQIESEVKKMI